MKHILFKEEIMSVQFVTALIHFPNEDRSKDKSMHRYFQLFNTLASTGIPIHAFLSPEFSNTCLQNHPNVKYEFIELKDMTTYHIINSLTTPPRLLPRIRTEYHDTKSFLTCINSKVEFVELAINKYPDATHFAWIDFGICHVFRDIDNTLMYIKMLSQSKLRTPCIAVPGCWSLQAEQKWRHDEQINWRFCGGFLIGDRSSLIDFSTRHREALTKQACTLTWEVNVWAYLESLGWNSGWYKADHNDSIITNLPVHHFARSVSLTTIPSRRLDLKLAIDSLLPQVDHVYVTIPDAYVASFSNIADVVNAVDGVDVPSFLVHDEPYKSKVIIVRGADRGPASKYLGALTYICDKNEWIFFCDDDQEYANGLIDRMLSRVTRLAVYQNRSKQITIDTSGGLIHGFVGCMIHSSLLKDLQAFPLPDAAYAVDDQWMSIYCFLNNIDILPTFIEFYSHIFKVTCNGHEKIGIDSLATRSNRNVKVQEIAAYFGVAFIANGKICLLKNSK